MATDKLVQNTEYVKIYRRIFGVSGIVQMLCMVALLQFNMTQLVHFTAVALVLHIVGACVVSNPNATTICVVSLFAEIVIFSTLCTCHFGWGYGFSFYGILLVPCCFFSCYLDDNIKKPWLNCMIFVAADVLLMVASTLFSDVDNLLILYGYSRMREFFFGNMLISVIAISVYAARIYKLLKQNDEIVVKKNQQLNYLAHYDNLTKLRNRNSIANRFHEFESKNEPYCAIMGDIDDFKQINDTYGHNVGDEALVSVAELVQKEMEDKGLACRWGGEEFLILCPLDKRRAVELIEKIRCKVREKRIAYGDTEIGVTMTFGVAASDEAANCEDMITLADKRLYVGKRKGKNRTIYQ